MYVACHIVLNTGTFCRAAFPAHKQRKEVPGVHIHLKLLKPEASALQGCGVLALLAPNSPLLTISPHTLQAMVQHTVRGR